MGQKQSRRTAAKIQANSEEIAGMEQKMAALEKKTVELEQAAQGISMKKAEYEQKLANMSETIDKQVLEKMEVKAECQRELANMSESMDKRVLEKMEIQKADYERRLDIMSQTMGELVQEKMEVKAECQQKLANMSESMDKRVLEKMEILEADYERRLAVMSQTMGELIQEKMEVKAECQQKLANISESMDKRVLEKMEIQKADYERRLAVMSQTMGELIQEKMEVKAECQQKLANISESMDKRVLEKMEIQKAECEQRLVLMSQTMDKLVQEKMAEKAQHEQKLVAMSKTIEKLVQEKTEEKARRDLTVVALMQRILQLEQEAWNKVPEFEQKLDLMTVKFDSLVLAKEEESLAIQVKLATLSESVESINSLLPGKKLESLEFQEKPASVSEKMDVLFQMTTSKEMTVELSASGYHNSTSVQSNRSVQFTSEVQTAAQGSSLVSQLQKEVGPPPPKQSLKKKGKSKHCKEPQKTSDERLLDPDLKLELKEVFILLNADEGAKIINGLELVHKLAENQPGVLIPKMEEVCVVILREVLNPWETMSHAALRTLSELLLYLEGHFDPFLECVVDAMLEKATSCSEPLRQAVNVVLGRMILRCDPVHSMKALLNGLCNQRKQNPDQDLAVRECVAVHLHALIVSKGPWFLFRAERELLLRFVTTIKDLSQDTSEVVRDHFSPVPSGHGPLEPCGHRQLLS